MKLVLKFRDFLMSTGLIPCIVCMIFCIFFQDATVLYVCSIASYLYGLYRILYPSIFHPNLVMLHGTVALCIAALIKWLTEDMLIPDQTVPITLEILILCFSLLQLILPDLYIRRSHNRIPFMLNSLAVQIIVILSAIHLFITCVIYLFFSPLSHRALYILTHILPPVVYIACIAVNYAYLKILSLRYERMPLLRIAPICNGKIYVTPRGCQKEEAGKWDIPIEDCIHYNETNIDKYIQEIGDKCQKHTGLEARFSLKHLIKTDSGVQKTIMLYVLPLKKENQIHVEGGKFVTPEEIEKNACQYSTLLQKEISHLSLAARMWKEFG